MPQKFGTSLLAFALASTVASCSQILPLEDAGSGATEADYSSLSSPLDLRHFEVVSSAGGYRGVFLRLSRFPDGIRVTHSRAPAQIIIDIQGPTGNEAAEESFPGGDSLVAQVRVLREIGLLRVVLDLAGSDLPDYTVHRMADWIMLRILPKA